MQISACGHGSQVHVNKSEEDSILTREVEPGEHEIIICNDIMLGFAEMEASLVLAGRAGGVAADNNNPQRVR